MSGVDSGDMSGGKGGGKSVGKSDGIRVSTPAASLVLAWGNASRGDDALGPMFAERVRALSEGRPDIECLDDYQLQVEHALDLVGRRRVLFVDASRDGPAPFEVSTLQAAADHSITSHALSPQALLQVLQRLGHGLPPSCLLLAIRGERFELGEPPSHAALAHLEAALGWMQGWMHDSRVSA